MTSLRKNRLAWLAAGLIALTAAGGLASCGKKGEDGPAKPKDAPRAVRVATIELRPMSGGLVTNGVFQAREEAVAGSEVQGYRVARVYADVNQWVRRGQTLAQLDDTLLRSQIAQQRAVAAQAEDQAKRVAGLDDAGVLSQEQVVQRRLQAASARAALQDLLVRQSRMAVRAPVSGRIMEKTVRPGDVSGPTAMFRIIRDGLVELEADVPESSLGAIAPGTAAEVIPANGQPVYGRVRFVSPAVDPGTRLGKVRIALPVRADLRPGGFGRANFTGIGGPVRSVPETAVRYGAEGASVMVVDAQNRAKEVRVRTGRHGGGWVELVSGPEPGQRVLLGGSAFVLDGDLVKPVAAKR